MIIIRRGIQIYRHSRNIRVGTDDAVKNAIMEASKTVKNLKWAELGRVTVRIDEGKIEFQAEVRMGFKIERES
jgi:dodecin